ncbi:MAG: excinuclease ABC subunit UvrA [Treponema sp.]|jgi:excinuclease ABC subunit A|nr:excinuclease ABC subunit UvrA [Treponema sp.]
MATIVISGAKEGNLKNIALEIPRDTLVVFSGVSGSGKSTLLKDVLYMECQRQYLEAMGYQGIHKPKVDFVRNVSPAIIITQTDVNKNPRSTVGTATNIYADLRMIFEKLGLRTCPKCKKTMSAADCKEETEKTSNDFKVYMYCRYCNHKMDKLTRTHFSFNTREGACPTCEGLGTVLSIDKDCVVNESLSLEDGAVAYWEQKYGEYQIAALYNAFRHYAIPLAARTPVRNFSEIQKAVLYHGSECGEVKRAFPEAPPPKTVASGRFEGVYPILWRRLSAKGGASKELNKYFAQSVCPDCKGERLMELSRKASVANTRLPELSVLSLEEIHDWIQTLSASLTESNQSLVQSYLLDALTKIKRILNVGLGYLSIDRQTITLSGGERQRIRLAAALDSDITGVIYIMDEPTIGLHPRDTEGIITALKKLRDAGNTVMVIEHDLEVMQAADYIVELGPGSGKHGGTVVGKGTWDELKRNKKSITGRYAGKRPGGKRFFRTGTGESIEVKNANVYNLQNIDVAFPVGCLTGVTGVSGSGKSTLVFEALAQERRQAHDSRTKGLDLFHQIVTIEQSAISKMKRSIAATYSEAYTEIRKIFAATEQAKEKRLGERHFSFNAKGGRCENCEGLGYVSSNMMFFENIDVVCPVCNGKQFNDEVLQIKYKGYSIKDVLQLSVDDALSLFAEHPKIKRILGLLQDVGLGYVELGQTTTTLSGGECQRLKLAKELINSTGKNNLYLLDEPTTGLHPADIDNFLVLLNRIVDSGNTVIVVEHNKQVINACDWIIDLGPEGGKKGGQVIFEGNPQQLLSCRRSATAKYLL